MLQTLRNIQSIRISSAVNRFMYYWQKLPGLGRLVRDHMYGELELKRVIAGIVWALRLIGGFVSAFLYLGPMLTLPLMLGDWTEGEQARLYWHIFLILSFLIPVFSSCKVLEPTREKYICVKLTRMAPAAYMKSTLALRYLLFPVYFLPAMLVFTSMLGIPLWQGVLAVLLATCFRVAAEAANLLIFEKSRLILVKNNMIMWIAILAGYALAYLPLLLNESPGWAERLLFGIPLLSMLVCGGLGVAGGLYLLRYPRYRRAVNAVTKIDEPLLNVGKMMAEAQVADVKTREQEFSEEELQSRRHEGKSGYDYLNAIFFQRHRRLLVQPIRLRLAVIAGCLAAGVLAWTAFPKEFVEYASRLTGALAIFTFIMYYASIGERVCKAMFYNCDSSLLRYSFYREKGVLLKNFRVRLLRIVLLNLIPALAICVSLVILISLSGAEWPLQEMIFYLLAIMGMSVFFSVHHLSMYYLLQPYTTEMKMKNPFFFIINGVVVGGCIVMLQIRSAPDFFALLVLGATFVYIGLALTLVYRLSPKTFRVK